MDMSKKTKMTAGIATAVVVGIVLIMIIPMMKKNYIQKQYQEQMDLGNRYLLEQDYEAAIVAFSKAIEIDPRQAESYLKAAEAYAGVGDYENAVLVLQQGYEFTGDERIAKKKEEYERYLNILPKVSAVFRDGDREGIWNYLETEEYQSLTADLHEMLKYKDENGKYLLVYPCGHSYYGNWENGKRTGNGLWADCDYNTELDEKLYDFFRGEWKDDFPNGEGVYYTSNVYYEKYGPNLISDLCTTKGMFHNGYENGRMVLDDRNIYDELESNHIGLIYHVREGIPEIIGYDDLQDPIVVEDEDGWYYSLEKGSEMEASFNVYHACKGNNQSMKTREENKEEDWGIESDGNADTGQLEESGDYADSGVNRHQEDTEHLQFITDEVRGGASDFNPEKGYFIAGSENDKGFCVPVHIMDSKGNIVASGYLEGIWMTENGYARIKYCYKGTDEEVSGKDEVDAIVMDSMEGSIFVELYDWNGTLLEQISLEDEDLWMRKAYEIFPQKV